MIGVINPSLMNMSVRPQPIETFHIRVLGSENAVSFLIGHDVFFLQLPTYFFICFVSHALFFIPLGHMARKIFLKDVLSSDPSGKAERTRAGG